MDDQQQDFLILYLEEDLDRAYRIDCKMRTRQDLAWIKREDFRKVYDELLQELIEEVVYFSV